MRFRRMGVSSRIGRLNDAQPIVLYMLALIGAVSFVVVVTFLITLRAQEQTTVPDIINDDLTTALLKLQERDLIPRIRLAYSDDQDTAGLIIIQSPSAGASVRAGKDITLTVSRGRAVFRLDSFIGQSIEEVNVAIKEIEAQNEASIQLANVIYVASSEPPGTVLEQSPLADSEVGIFTQLDLVISLGEETGGEEEGGAVVIPDLRNAHFEGALEVVLREGIQFRFFIQEDAADDDDDAAYRVASQSPSPGSILTDEQLAITITSPSVVDLGFSFDIYEYDLKVNDTLNPQSSFLVQATISDTQQQTLVEYPSLPQIVSVPYLLPEGSVIELISEEGILDSVVVE